MIIASVFLCLSRPPSNEFSTREPLPWSSLRQQAEVAGNEFGNVETDETDFVGGAFSRVDETIFEAGNTFLEGDFLGRNANAEYCFED